MFGQFRSRVNSKHIWVHKECKSNDRKLKFDPSDQFTAFGETLIQRLCAMGEGDALCRLSSVRQNTIIISITTAASI